MSESKYKNYDVKDGYIVQTKMFHYRYLNYGMKYEKRKEISEKYGDVRSKYGNKELEFSSTEAEILCHLNLFASTVDVLDIIPIGVMASSFHDGTFSKTSESYSAPSKFLLIYQIPKKELINRG